MEEMNARVMENEVTYDRMCLVNNAVYIAKYATAEKCQLAYGYVPGDIRKHPGEWNATGTQFQIPYVFKKLFSREEIVFEDIPASVVVQPGLGIFHALLVCPVLPQTPRKAGDQGTQTRCKQSVPGNGSHHRLLIPHHSGLNPLSQPGTDRKRTPLFLLVFCAKVAGNVLWSIAKCADKHNDLLILGTKKPDRKVRPVTCRM